MSDGTGRRRAIRLLLGLIVSGIFIAATLRGLDLSEVAAALGRVAPAGVLLAVGVVGFEFLLRAHRWQRLLRPLAPVPLRRSAAYLAIGYFANTMLPARLGDLARAYLAGQAFGIGRLSVLGTVVVERLADGLFILAIVATLGLVLAGGASLASTALWLAVLAGIGSAGLILAILLIRSSGEGRVRMRIRSLMDRVLLGAVAIRSPGGLIAVALLTAAAFGSAVVMFSFVAGAAGVELTLAQCALAMGGLALSTSIPAAPGSIGTYEFVGLTILVALGLPPETALAIVVVVHAVVTLPVAVAGLLVAWQLHFRISEIAADAEPSLVVPAEG